MQAEERGELVPQSLSAKERQFYERAASSTLEKLKKDKNINIRLSQLDIDGLKFRAAEAGIPYQTLVTIVLRKVATGKLKITV